MIIRIVSLTIFPEKVEEAESFILEVAPKVRAMAGCTFLEIIQDIHKPGNWTTYSYWDSESDLNEYRHSETFRNFWGQVKPLFREPARAWSSRRRVIQH